jgi:hypothetical protein
MRAATEASRRTLERVRDRLRRDGWAVGQGYTGEYFNIKLQHPLTSGFGFGFPNDEDDHTAFVERALAAREFRVIAERPDPIVHESLLGSIRVAARANQWEPSVVAIVARVLRHEGVLTDAEAEWLEEAGPAWIEEDRPAT